MKLSTKETLTKQEALAIKSYRNKAVVSSLRIAELTGKDHSKVIRDIKEMLQQIDSTFGQFTLQYVAGNKVSYAYMALPKRELELLLTGYSIPYRMKLLDELEQHRSKVSPTLATSKNTEIMGFEDSSQNIVSSNSSQQSPTKAQLILLAMQQNQQLIDMIKEIDEPAPIDTVIVNDDTKLSDLVGGKTKKALKIVGL